MVKPLEVFVGTNGDVEAIYKDETANGLRQAGVSFVVDRFSRIEPISKPRWWEWFCSRWSELRARKSFVAVHGTGYFGIFWMGPMRKRGIELSIHGRPFLTRAEALEHEEAVIRAEYFKVN